MTRPFLDRLSRRCLPLRPSPRRGSRAAWPLAVAWIGCAGGLERGAPLPDPAEVAERAARGSGAAEPTRVIFDWEYADERGNLRGEGVGRVNPPDRFRLDLFSTGEGSMRATLVDGRLDASGDLDEIELPPPEFLYAMTGLFRPGPAPPDEGFQSGPYEVVAYPAAGGGARYFYLLGGKLQRVEERRAGSLVRRIELEWGPHPVWPREARYRDDVAPNRVRWALERVIPQADPFPDDIYELGPPR